MIHAAHEVLAWVVVFANAIVGVWALGAHMVEQLRTKALWVGVVFAQVLCFVEVGLGVARLSQLDREAPQMHTFYGFLTLIAVAILYGYRTQLSHMRYLLYGGGSLFIMGLAIRAMVLSAGPVTG